MQRGATFCLSVFWALTFESLDLGMCFLVCRCVFRISRSALTHTCHGHWVKLRSKEQKVCLCVLFMGGLPSTERHLCSMLSLSRVSGRLLQVTEQHPTNGLWKGFRCTTSGLMTRPGYFPATSVVLIDPQSELSHCVLNAAINVNNGD